LVGRAAPASVGGRFDLRLAVGRLEAVDGVRVGVRESVAESPEDRPGLRQLSLAERADERERALGPGTPPGLLSVAVGSQSAQEVDLAELRPVGRTEEDSGLVSVGLPGEEVRCALVAARPDDEVDVARRPVVEGALDGLDVDVGGVQVARGDVAGDPAGGRQEFRPAPVGECDVEVQRVVAPRPAIGVVDGVPDSFRELVEFADGPDADLGLVDAVGVRELPELLGDEVEDVLALGGRPVEVLRREGIQGQFVDAEVVTPAEDRFRRLGAGPVAVAGVATALVGVATVPVLDHGHVARRLGQFPSEQVLVGAIQRAAQPTQHRSGFFLPAEKSLVFDRLLDRG